MSDPGETQPNGTRKIVIMKNGSYHVHGYLPLVHKTQVVSEHGEPLTWKSDGPIATSGEMYRLCRCGGSGEKPFCDGSHHSNGFDGTETADPGGTAERQYTMPGGTRLIVKKDSTLCMDAGFCGMSHTTLEWLVVESADTAARSLAMAMVERCPSGALTYRVEVGGPEIEPDLPQQAAITTEITSDGPIAGPIWVTGGIPVERSDGQALETRNRVTLCNCGKSGNKPLCDGTHRYEAERNAPEKK